MIDIAPVTCTAITEELVNSAPPTVPYKYP